MNESWPRLILDHVFWFRGCLCFLLRMSVRFSCRFDVCAVCGTGGRCLSTAALDSCRISAGPCRTPELWSNNSTHTSGSTRCEYKLTHTHTHWYIQPMHTNELVRRCSTKDWRRRRKLFYIDYLLHTHLHHTTGLLANWSNQFPQI